MTALEVLKKYILRCLRAVAIILCFTIEVKVKADVLVKRITGNVDVEQNQKLVKVKNLSKLTEPFDVQTFSNASAQFQVNSVELGLGEKTYVQLAHAPEFEVYWGLTYFNTPHLLRLKTPQANLETENSEFIISVDAKKTRVWVISGAIHMKDRSSGEDQNIRAGYHSWQGGLLAVGKRAKGALEACDFDFTLSVLKNLGPYSHEEWLSKHDQFRIVWKKAIDDLAQQTQDQISGDLQLLKDHQDEQAKRQAREAAERREMKKYFRAKALGEPPRSPASEN